MVCTYDVNMNTMTYNQAMEYIDQEKCATYVLKSQPGKTSLLVTVSVVQNIV